MSDTPGHPIQWRFTAQPAQLTGDQFWERYSHWNMPEKFEAMDGKLFWGDEQRFHVLGMLIESLGTEAVLAFVARHQPPAPPDL